jgi:hypothetical protein
MRAVVLYESLTGNTRRAGELIAGPLQGSGVGVDGLCPLDAIDLPALAAADLVVVGSWTDGIFVVGQRPRGAARLGHLPAMRGKRAVVYCTYALNPGKTIPKMQGMVATSGADVIGGLALHRRRLEAETADFTERLLEAVRA